MDHFLLDKATGDYYCEEVRLKDLARQWGTPLFVYSQATLERHCERFLQAFSHYPTLACYAVKANSLLAILRKIFNTGFGADVVSMGELKRSLKAGCLAKDVVFSGVGKTDEELMEGIHAGIYAFNVEAIFELDRLIYLSRQLNKKARISLRVNPDIDAQTHPYISTGMHSNKFGLSEHDLPPVLKKIKEHDSYVQLVGLSCHIGSQMTDLKPLKEAAKRMMGLVQILQAQGYDVEFIDMGGGLGIHYKDEDPPALEDYAKTLIDVIKPSQLRLVVEPGRVIVGNTGVLLTRVLGVKKTSQKNFVVVDAAMTELMRPALYGAYHKIEPIETHLATEQIQADIVGPVCESTDVLGKDRWMPANLKRGDLLMIRGCGAYASSMAFNYNSRCRPAEIYVHGETHSLIQRRENLEDLWSREC